MEKSLKSGKRRRTVNWERIWAVGPCTAPSHPLNRMLPRVKPLATAPPLFCLWKPSVAPLPAVALLLYIWKPVLKVVVAYTARVLVLLVPMTVLPSALNVLPLLMIMLELAVIGAEKVDVALTDRV